MAHPTLTSDLESWKIHAQDSHLTMRGTHPPSCQNDPTLTSDHGRNLILSPCENGTALTSHLDSLERLSPYIWPWLVRKALSPRLRIPGNWPGASIQRMTKTLISNQVGTHPCTHIWSCKTTSHIHIRMALSPRLGIPGNWPGTSIQRMAIALISDHVRTNPTVTSEWLSALGWWFLVTDHAPPFQ